MIFNQMQSETLDLLEKIKLMPFNQELMKGTLSKEIFIFYLQQDMLYLTDFSRALAITATRMPNHELMHDFLQFAMGALNAEKSLHLDYLKKYQVTNNAKPTPACFSYTNYLLRMAALETVEESAAALLPCFWGYQEVGQAMLRQTSEKNPYFDWIALYGGADFAESVQKAIHAINLLGASASSSVQNKMVHAFKQATFLEYCFWRDAYHGILDTPASVCHAEAVFN